MVICSVLFDLDGVVIDSRRALLETYREVTSAVIGQSYPATADDASLALNMPPADLFELLTPDPDLIGRLVSAAEDVYVARTKGRIRLRPGVPAALTSLAALNVTVALVSSRGERPVHQDLQRCGVDRFPLACDVDLWGLCRVGRTCGRSASSRSRSRAGRCTSVTPRGMSSRGARPA